MARIRSVKPAFFRHRRLYMAERQSGLPLRVAFAGLWTCADREGRFKWEPEELKLDCLPYDDLDFSEALEALTAGGFIQKYEFDGRLYGLIPSWAQHQVINQREAKSVIPCPTVDDTAHAGTCAHLQLSGEGKGKEQEGNGNGREAEDSAALRGVDRKATLADEMLEQFADRDTDPSELRVIRAFDRARVMAFGGTQARPYPASDDRSQAQRFLENGATLELCADVFSSVMQRVLSKGRNPPANLAYMAGAISDAIAARKAPMPAGTTPTLAGARLDVGAYAHRKAASS